MAGRVESVGLGMGVRSMVLPVPPKKEATVPLGVTSVSEVPAANVSQPVASAHVKEEELEAESESAYQQLLVKVLATASNVVLQLSPLPLVMTMKLKKSTLDYSPFPFVALTACGYQWSFYGYFAYTATANVGFLMLVYANILGLVLGAYYLWTFARVSSDSLVWLQG